ncbi:hypothetical protein SI65_05350 [Aspergillus cristatus]|uniref:BZIP domain-containing protein n=1 Tax=Aspergillus cristatus TaxID=573508 RepID=A0A1E3BCN4_ASPCR|nr:hypothetical protein SI65_05350 [Aspergillus cristatus]
MSPNRDTPTPRKRESRAGTRKVTSLSAEQLERKRANDREAQRTIRQRTKEHIENLKLQVAELKAKGQQFDEVVRRNAILEEEISRLRHQLAIVSGRPGYSDPHASYNSPAAPSLPPQLPGPLGLHPASRAPSVLSTPSQVSLAPDWQHYSSARSPSSLCETSETEYPNRVESYMLGGGQLQAPKIPSQAPASIPVAPPQMPRFNASGGTRLPDPTTPSYSQYYPTSNPHPGHGEDLPQHSPQPGAMVYGAAPRSMPDASIPPPDKGPGEYPVFPQQQPQFQNALGRPQGNQSQYTYPWYQQS